MGFTGTLCLNWWTTLHADMTFYLGLKCKIRSCIFFQESEYWNRMEGLKTPNLKEQWARKPEYEVGSSSESLQNGSITPKFPVGPRAYKNMVSTPIAVVGRPPHGRWLVLLLIFLFFYWKTSVSLWLNIYFEMDMMWWAKQDILWMGSLLFIKFIKQMNASHKDSLIT